MKTTIGFIALFIFALFASYASPPVPPFAAVSNLMAEFNAGKISQKQLTNSIKSVLLVSSQAQKPLTTNKPAALPAPSLPTNLFIEMEVTSNWLYSVYTSTNLDGVSPTFTNANGVATNYSARANWTILTNYRATNTGGVSIAWPWSNRVGFVHVLQAQIMSNAP